MSVAFAASVGIGILAGCSRRSKRADTTPSRPCATSSHAPAQRHPHRGQGYLGHKFRSLLTMLGIILGVASLVGMTAIVKGMENGLKEAMIAMGGADKVLIRDQPVPPHQEHLADEAPGRTMADVLRPPRKRAPHQPGFSRDGP
jgi:hypothetical protein